MAGSRLPAAARPRLDALAEAQPEAGPWLALVAETQREAANPAWDQAAAGVRLRAEQTTPTPLLTGASVTLDSDLASGWLRRLLAMAADASPETAPLAAAAESRRLDALALLETAANQDAERLATQALTLGVDPDALSAVAQLAALPLLRALHRRLAAAVPGDWGQGCCPVCGAWPALSELRGLERARRLRCGRCGADWSFVALRCPFCGNADHAALASLVPAEEGEARRAETCARCRGYLKSVATLRPWSPDEVLLADLATVELDLAALDRGFARPAAPAVVLDLRLTAATNG